MDNEDGFFPVATSLVGALSVVTLYWLHLFLVEQTMTNTPGVSLTIFFAAFFSQFIPLRRIASNFELEKKN
jgi:ABC-type multidrug transport system fused ATPase/permease subunit